MLPLSSGTFDMPEWTSAKIHRDHHFVIKGNFYSVPTRYLGAEVSVRIGLKTVSAYYQHRIIKTHPRNYDTGQWITDQTDYPESALYHLASNSQICLDLAESIGSAPYELIKKVVAPDTKVG